MICNDLSEMVLELKILFHNKVAIQQINQYKLMKQGGLDSKPLFTLKSWNYFEVIDKFDFYFKTHKDSNLEFLWLNLCSIDKLIVNFS
jgi:hypothetical protein